MVNEKVCPYCGEKYYEIKNIPLWIPNFIREQMKFQPRCTCLKEIEEKRRKEQEEERKREVIRKKVNKYKDISLIDAKLKMINTMKNILKFLKDMLKKL